MTSPRVLVNRLTPTRLFGLSRAVVLDAIVDRVRTAVRRQPGENLFAIAAELNVSLEQLQHFIAQRDATIDAEFLIDVIAALVHQAGVDPKWLLTGNYDAALHRHALHLGEDRSAAGVRKVRELIREEYRTLRRGTTLWPTPRAIRTLFTRVLSS